MGYCVSVTCNGMKIAKAKVKKALEAINAIPVKGQGPNSYSGYAWVTHNGKQTDLVKALSGWRYGAVVEKNGSVTIEYFNGEKSGDDENLWKAIAPFIIKGAEVEYLGEDGCQWKYVFDGHTYKEKQRSSEWV